MALEREHVGTGLRTATTFASRLASLKRNGCNLLVVGGGHEPTCSDACRRLLACGGDEPRRRVVVTADTPIEAVRDRLPAAEPTAQNTETTIIDWETPTRATATESAGGPSQTKLNRVPVDDLSQLGVEIHEGITQHAEKSDLQPSELRLCFDSLTPLVARYDPEVAFQFLHLVTGCVTNARGMGHYHLPVGRNAEIVRVLEPIFDGIVELRTQGGCTEQRWHVPDEQITTDWLPV